MSVKLTIDGKEITAPEGELLIKAAQDNGIFIPRFCWHERMKPVGMCRMCLVEVEGVRGLPPACTTPVTDGMVVHMQKDNVRKVQDGVLEFLLVNHPLDCPVCDRGGECPLQDQTLAFGPGESRFVEEKRHFEKPIPISDLVLLDRERCIQCARCTRFADEVAGDPLISFVDRGEQTQVLNFPDEPFASYFSGNTVQICPVGALTSKPYRFKARPWDISGVETSCNTCAVQCRGELQGSGNRLTRLLGVDSDPVNHGWLCDKGRFSYEWVHANNRLQTPSIRRNGLLEEVAWPEAIDAAAQLLRETRDQHGPDAIGLIGGARGTNEDAYAWSRLFKSVLRSDNADAQLADGLSADLMLGVERATINDLDDARAVVVLAGDLKEELPILYLRARRAATELGVPIIELATHDTGLTPYANVSLRYLPGEQSHAARQVLGALKGQKNTDPNLASVPDLVNARDGDIILVLGRPSVAESEQFTLDAARVLLEMGGIRVLSALRRGNVHGALDMGLTPGFLPGRVALSASGSDDVPDSPGLDTKAMLGAAAHGTLKTLVLLGADVLADVPDHETQRAIDAIEHLIVVDTHASAHIDRAEVVLPAAMWGEKSGSMTNLEGRVQRVAPKVTSPGTAMPDWRIAQLLAQQLGEVFGWENESDVTDEIARVAPAYAACDSHLLDIARDGVVVPAAEHRDQIVLGGRIEIGEMYSWEPIRPKALETVVEFPELASPDVALYEFHSDMPETVAEISTDSLRLVAVRKLYDNANTTSLNDDISGLGKKPATLKLHSSDAARIGTERVRVQSNAASIELDRQVDDSVLPGSAVIVFNTTDGAAQKLLDVEELVTAVRVTPC